MSAMASVIRGGRYVVCGLEALSPVLDLGIRLWLANAFFASGLTKIQSWSTTLTLFEYEYEVPVIGFELAAYLGTAAELVLPVLLAWGLATRPAAVALFVFNLVAMYSYPFLQTDEGYAGYLEHLYWGLLMLVPIFHGPGRISLDYFLSAIFRARH